MAQQVFPTKSNLMATKRSLALATQGYDLMDRKRNILWREMMQLDRPRGIQDRISAAYAEAYEALKKANIMLGSVGGYAAGVPVERGVQLSTRSVMGVELPTLNSLQPAAGAVLRSGINKRHHRCGLPQIQRGQDLDRRLAEVEQALSAWPRPSKRPRSAPTPWATCRYPRCKRPSSPSTRSWSEREREEFSRLKVIKAQKEKRRGVTQAFSLGGASCGPAGPDEGRTGRSSPINGRQRQSVSHQSASMASFPRGEAFFCSLANP